MLKISDTCQIPCLAEIYESFFEKTGTFVEIGANDGEMASNTSCLADLGWHGVYVEPDLELASKCKLRHISNDVEVYCYAISGKEEIIKLDRVQGGLSTASVDTRAAHREIPWARDAKHIDSIEVQAITLDSLLVAAKVERDFDLLVVDVEGFEENVFQGFSINVFRPRMLIVELCDYHPSFIPYPSLQAPAMRVRNHILNNNYVPIYADPINTIFVTR